MVKLCEQCQCGFKAKTIKQRFCSKKCSGKGNAKNKSVAYSTSQFIKEAIKVHGHKYDYSITVCNGMKNKVYIKCAKHGIFSQSPRYHLRGCVPSCCSDNKRKTIEEFIEQAREVHGDKYDYSSTDYKSLHKKIIVICPTHGAFTQKPTHHLNGHECRLCAMPRGEKHHLFNHDREYVRLRKKMAHRAANLVLRCLAQVGSLKDGHMKDIVGYTATDLYKHITSHPNWINVKDKKWAIDHIFPVKAFVKHGITDMRKINALDNLQPMDYYENASKGGRYDEVAFLAYLKRSGGVNCPGP